MLRRAISSFLLAVAVAGLFAGCGSPRRGEPLVGPVPLGASGAAAGKVLYDRHCGPCHPGGESGVGPALNNKPLPSWLMKFQVRHGLGAMPSFDETRIGADDLDRLVEYLLVLRRHQAG